jgi:hypothetical protein
MYLFLNYYVEWFNVNQRDQILQTDDTDSVFVRSAACPGPLKQAFVFDYVCSSAALHIPLILYDRSCAILQTDIVAK